MNQLVQKLGYDGYDVGEHYDVSLQQISAYGVNLWAYMSHIWLDFTMNAIFTNISKNTQFP